MPIVVTFCYLLKVCLEEGKSNCLFFSPKEKSRAGLKFELMSDDSTVGTGCQHY